MEDARGRRAELQTEMDGMGMTSRLNVLAEDMRLRKEELASLRGDVESPERKRRRAMSSTRSSRFVSHAGGRSF